MEDKKELVQKKVLETKLSYYTNQYTELMQRDFDEYGISFDEYSRQCVVASMSAIYQLVNGKKADLSVLNGSNMREILGKVASLRLNANAVPRECYFKIVKQQNAQGTWEQIVEMGIEGDGNDALLRNFGLNVETVYPCWLIREGDEFTYPKRKGLETNPPEWEEKGLSEKIVRVVYPIKLKDGTVQYQISARDGVNVNLFAHIRNNLMNETFGLVKGGKKTRYDATDTEKKAIEVEKEKIYSELRKCETVDDMLKCELARPYISAAWLDTSESMIVRKMRNNATKKFPKNFNTMARQSFLELDDTYVAVQAEIEQKANKEDFIVDESESMAQEEAKTDDNLPDFMK